MPQDRAPAGRTSGSSVERSYARKIADLIAFLCPFLLIAGLALAGGGYDLFTRHLSGILSWVLVAVLLIGPWPDRIRPGRSLALIGGLLLALALFSAFSSIWSSSVAASLAEFERGIGYLGFFTASYLTMRTPKQREWFARGIAAGLAVIVLMAIGERLISGIDPGASFGLSRLSYPLGYWNADGVASACALVLFTWFAANTPSRWWRLLSIALAVLAGASLYLTYSRGGLLTATLALVLVFFMTPVRLRVLLSFLVTAAATVPVLVMINRYPTISGEGQGSPTMGQTMAVVLVIIVSVAFAFLLFQTVMASSAKRPALTRRVLARSRDRRLLYTVAGVGLAAILVLILAFGNNIWDQFSDSDVPVATDAKSRFTELSGSWRYEFNQVAIETFADHPLLGSGAGTYPTEWSMRREVPVVTQDAHSFYLENFAELGVLGGLLSLAMAISLVWLGLNAWRRRLGREAPVIFALATGLLVAMAFDWFWKLGATAALLMLLAAWIATAETVAPERRRVNVGSGFRVAGLVGSWLAVVVLAVPAAADHYTQASADSVRAGKIDQAVDQARRATQLNPWDPDPLLQLGAIAESRGQYSLALSRYDEAIELEPENWRARLFRFRLNYNAGQRAAAKQDFEAVKKLNPAYFGEFSFREFREEAS